MIRHFALMLLMTLPLCASAITLQVDKPSSIDYYTGPSKKHVGTYMFSYTSNRLDGIIYHSLPAESWEGSSYLFTYGNDDIEMKKLDADHKVTSIFNFKWINPESLLSTFEMPGFGNGTISFTKKNTKTYFKYNDGKTAEVDNKAKFSNDGLSSVSSSSGFGKSNIEIKYSDIMYPSKFDFLSFILNNFYGIDFGYFLLWPVQDFKIFDRFPKEIKTGQCKYCFTYDMFADNCIGVEIKVVKNNSMVSRSTFIVNK